MRTNIPLKLFVVVVIILALTLLGVEFAFDNFFSLAMIGDSHGDIHLTLLGIGVSALVLEGGAIGLSFYFMLQPYRQMATNAKYASSGPHSHSIATSSDLAKRLEGTMNDLAEERNLSNAVLEGVSNGIIATDGEGHILLCNRAAQRMLGCQCLNGNMRHNTNPAASPSCLKRFTNETKEDRVVDKEIVLDSGTVLLIKGGRFEGRKGMVFVIKDITESRKLEKMRKEFVANVSHELRTPLSTMHSSLEALLAGGVNNPERALSFVTLALQNSTLLSKIVANLLDLSRIDAGAYRMDIQSISVLAAGHRVFRRVSEMTTAKGLVTEMLIPEGTRILADEQAFDHILTNLITNAVKYTPKNGCITLRARPEDNIVKIEVQDTGAGIAPELRLRIFERFFRIDPGRSREAGGTGLGLAIVQDLVKQMNGKVWVECPECSGSVFCVTLPREII